MASPHRPSRLADCFDSDTKDLTADDLQQRFTRDTRDADAFFTRSCDAGVLKRLPWRCRFAAEVRILFLPSSMKLSPAWRLVYRGALVLPLIGVVKLLRGIGVPGPLFRQGTWSLLFAFGLMNSLVLQEIADRLSLKNDFEIARDIQQATLPSRVCSAPGVTLLGQSRPANTVGGDFSDILPLEDGCPAIALFYGVFQPFTGDLTCVSAGHIPPLLMPADGTRTRLSEGGITEADNPKGVPFDQIGLETALRENRRAAILSDTGATVVRSVERHTGEHQFADDLTILLLRRTIPVPAGVSQ